ncbi:hypothetical protein [Streptomyces sp. NPDC057582]|uniref:hypothetical protein n=1 Tax=Streptomyces sp. NPDC057582 TaxID=3346174 RepID=UPI0036C03BF4
MSGGLRGRLLPRRGHGGQPLVHSPPPAAAPAPEASAKLASANTLAHIGGPALANGLIGVIGAARAVAADAVSYVVTAWCTLPIRIPEAAPSPRAERPSLRSEIRAGLAYTWRHPLIGPLVTTNAITSIALTGTNATRARTAAGLLPSWSLSGQCPAVR